MPQFDISSFKLQIFFLFFIFSFLYFLVVYNYLPKNIFLLKLRKRFLWAKEFSFREASTHKLTNLKKND